MNLSNEQQPSLMRSMTSEEMLAALVKASLPSKPLARIRRNTPEPSDTTTHRFTFRPFPEKPEEEKHEPDAAPQTIETLKDLIRGLSLQKRIDAVSEFYRAKPSLLESLTPDKAAELLGIEFLDDPDERHRWDFADLPEDTDFFEYHEATLTLNAGNGGRIVFSTRYNDVKEQRFVHFHRY